jgi:trk system potassium uptake protein TrkA
MNIILIGCGTVGNAICHSLVNEGHNVTVIDNNEGALSELCNSCDVTGLIGNGIDITVLKSAGAERADLLIAVTNEDEINLLSCHAAKTLGVKHSVARVRDPKFAEYIELMKNDMGLSFTINPELAAAKEISRILKFPSAAKIDTFGRGRADIAEFTVAEGSPLCGATLSGLRASLNANFLVCAVSRGEETYIPSGDFIIQEGDMLGVAGSEAELVKFFKEIKMYKRPVKNVLAVGAGRTTYYLAELMRHSKVELAVIERDKGKCESLAEEFSINIIKANPTNQNVLLEEGIESAEAFLALSDTDEENAIMSMYASSIGVPKVVTMIRSLPFVDFFKEAGIESVISPRSLTVAYILRFIRALSNAQTAEEIETMRRIMDDKIEATEFIVKEHIDGITDTPLKSIKKKSGVLIACILRDGDTIIPSGEDMICRGDAVIIITNKTINSLKEIKN